MRTLSGIVAALASLGFVAVSSAQTKPADAMAPARPALAKASVPGASTRSDPYAVQKLFRKRVESVEWADTPFEEVLDWLRTESDGRVNVLPRWTALTEEQVETDTPVTLRLKDVTVGQVLDETLKALSPTEQLGYHSRGGNVLEIATKAYFSREMITLVYDVSDIVVRIPDFGQNAPQIDLQQAGQSGGGGGGGGGGSRVFAGGTSGSEQGESGEQAEQAMRTRLEEMAKNIQETIAVETWDLGQTGGRGRIRVQGRYLFIHNTIEVHEMIGGPVTLKD